MEFAITFVRLLLLALSYPIILAEAQNNFPTTLTIGLIGPYAKLTEVTLEGSLVVSEIVTAANVESYTWVYDDMSFFYWNDVGAQIAIDQINKNQTLFPNTTIVIKRFNDFDPHFLDSPGNSAGYAIQIAQEIQQDHPDVAAIFGGLMTGTTLKTAEIYKLPYCTAYQLSSRFLDRNLYPYYMSMTANSGMAESFCLILHQWNVKRVGLITSTGSKEIIAGFGACGIHIVTLSKIDTHVTLKEMKEIGGLLKYYDIRYVVLDSDPATSGFVYFALATLNMTVGPNYVWLGTNYPYPVDDGVKVLGKNYKSSMIKDFIFLYGENPKAPNFASMFEAYVNAYNEMTSHFNGTPFEYYEFDPLNGMSAYDCINMLAYGFKTFFKQNH
ncbi:periplasmic binding protein-like I [Obelidium mucronatum]|nr:periplasmic binding protein-like I [Obelidium mucronatum]